MSTLGRLAAAAAEEIVGVLNNCDGDPLAVLVSEIVGARSSKIMLYGVGREGLMMRALAMRLAHLGLNSHCVGDMAAPPLGHGDLFLTSAGPGSFSTVDALAGIAHRASARVVLLTAQPNLVHAAVDRIVALPARTMVDHSTVVGGTLTGVDRLGETLVDRCEVEEPLLPMGSVYEGALFILFELVVSKLRGELSQTDERLRNRHTNME